MSLSDAARHICRLNGWVEIQFSRSWTELDRAVAAKKPGSRKEQRIHLEMIPLRKSLYGLASRFGLLYKREPANWAMDTIVETLAWAGSRPKKKRSLRWCHPIILSHEYPALTEPGWTNASTGLPEDELFPIVIIIPPKQPTEDLKAFQKRFNETCRNVRKRYIKDLKAEEWETRPPYPDFTWVDRFAQWQAGRSASEIDASIKTPNQRSVFSRRIKQTGDYIKITPRLSKHDPKVRSRH